MTYGSIPSMRLREVIKRRWPVAIELASTMPGPPATVWRLITDWEHQDDWMLEASDFVVTSPHREGIGVTAEATITIGGISTRDSVEVVGWELNKLLAIEHQGWVSGRGELHLLPLAEDRTHLYWVEYLYPPLGLLGAIGMHGFRPLMERVFRRDLRVLEGLVRVASAG